MSEHRQLSGWGEVAAYLGVSVRAAQMYESRLNLPVHRLPGPKGRVWADPAELDSWRGAASRPAQGAALDDLNQLSEAKLTPSGPPDADSPGYVSGKSADAVATVAVAEGPSSPTARKFWPARRGILGAGVIGALIAVTFWFLAARRAGPPVSFQVESQVLRTYDSHGKQVWEYALPGTWNADAYKKNPPPSDDGRVRGVFADLDGDGRQDLIFIYWRMRNGSSGDTDVYCFQADGAVRWKKTLGRTVETTGGTTLYENYVTTLLGVLKKPRPDGGQIVVGSHHAFSWPYQVVLLTADGRQVAEYWHPGWLFRMQLADIDGDGAEEIILGGVNNGYSKAGYDASLVVLDSKSFGGQGPVPPGDGHQIQGVPPGNESAVLLFPEFADDPAHPENFCRITGIDFAGEHLDVAVTKVVGPSSPKVHYQLSNSLQIASVTPSMVLVEHSLDFLPPPERQARLLAMLKSVKVVRNRFAVAVPAGAENLK